MSSTPWDKSSLPLCSTLRPAIRVAFPWNGATCVNKKDPEAAPTRRGLPSRAGTTSPAGHEAPLWC